MKKADNIVDHTKQLSEKKSKYFTIQDEKSLEKVIKELIKADVISIDTETSSIKPLEAKLIGISISYKIGEAFYIPINHNIKDKKKQLCLNLLIKKLNPLLSNPSLLKVGQNIKYDLDRKSTRLNSSHQ